MRIAFVTRKSWPAVGGAEAHLRLLARALAETNEVRVLAQRIHDGEINLIGDLVLPRPPFATFTDGAVRVEALRASALARGAVAADLVAVLTRMRARRTRVLAPDTYDRFAKLVGAAIASRLRGAEIVHVICGGNLAGAAVQAAMILGVPAVVTPFAHPGQHDDDAASGMAYRSADAVVATTATDASVYLGLGVDPGRITVAGVCTEGLVSGGGVALRRSEGIEGPLVVFVGVRRPHKGLDLLLAAAPEILARHANARFAFIGPGEPLPRQGPEILDLGILDAFHKAAWVEAADVLCLPSANESFGLVVTEAWSVGTPVVTSDLPVLRELVGAGGGGITVSREPRALAAALLSLLDDPPRARELGEAGRAYWRGHYRPSLVARVHEQLYRRLSQDASTRRPAGASPLEALARQRFPRHRQLSWR